MPDLLDTEKYVAFGAYHLNLYKNDISFRKTTNWFVDWFSRFVTDKKLTVLDMGAGEGLYVKVLSERGYKITGLDLNKIAVGLAKENSLDVEFANVNNFTKPADIGLLIHVFEHLDKPDIAVENITKNIKKEVYIVNPLWASDYHYDNYDVKKIEKVFSRGWSLADYKKIGNLEFIRLVRKQKENHNNVGLLQFEGKHQGRPCIIYSPGPSINKFRGLKGDFVTIGVKQAIETPYNFDYYFFGDKNERSIKYEDKIRWLNSTKIALCTIDGEPKPALYTPEESRKFGAITANLGNYNGCEYSTDIVRGSYRQGSSTHAAINFAIFAGMRDIYLVGCDCSASKDINHIDNSLCEHYRNVWREFDNYFDFITYTIVNPVNVFARKHKVICQ